MTAGLKFWRRSSWGFEKISKFLLTARWRFETNYAAGGASPHNPNPELAMDEIKRTCDGGCE